MSIPFCELYSAFNGISHYELFAIFRQNRWHFNWIILLHTMGRGPNKLLIKSSEIKLLQRNKVDYCFNSNGDNFNVSQLYF